MTIGLSVMCRERVNDGQLQTEVADPFGNPGVRVVFDSDGGIKGGHRESVVAAYGPQQWYKLTLDIDAVRHGWRLSVNDKVVLFSDPMIMPIRSVSRLILRTGERRREPTLDTNRFAGDDLPLADEKAAPVTFCINNVKTSGHELP